MRILLILLGLLLAQQASATVDVRAEDQTIAGCKKTCQDYALSRDNNDFTLIDVECKLNQGRCICHCDFSPETTITIFNLEIRDVCTKACKIKELPWSGKATKGKNGDIEYPVCECEGNIGPNQKNATKGRK